METEKGPKLFSNWFPGICWISCCLLWKLKEAYFCHTLNSWWPSFETLFTVSCQRRSLFSIFIRIIVNSNDASNDNRQRPWDEPFKYLYFAWEQSDIYLSTQEQVVVHKIIKSHSKHILYFLCASVKLKISRHLFSKLLSHFQKKRRSKNKRW